MAKQAIAENKCCVIGLQSTGEARTQDVVAERGEELDDFVSGPRVSSNKLRWHFQSKNTLSVHVNGKGKHLA